MSVPEILEQNKAITQPKKAEYVAFEEDDDRSDSGSESEYETGLRMRYNFAVSFGSKESDGREVE